MPVAKPAPAPAPAAGDSAAASLAPAPSPSPTPAAANGNATPQKPPIPAAGFDMPKPNLRGLNKPKCIQCGNVARSRCPFQCCKACCYKAQNPCHIHVLKQTNTLPDKPSPTTAPVSEQPSTNSLLTGSASRLASLQRLPHHFLNALRTKKSLAKKDVAGINKWRFMKLREHMQGEIDVENEAYERYTQNVGLLEEIFCPTQDTEPEPEPEPEPETNSEGESMDILVSEAIARLKSDTESADSFKERVATLLDQKLKKLLENQTATLDQSPSDQNADDHTKAVMLTRKQKQERSAKTNELLGKLTRARNEDDLKTCHDIVAELFGNENDSSMDKWNQVELLPRTQESSVACSFPKLWTRVEVDENFASKINDEFASVGQIAQL